MSEAATAPTDRGKHRLTALVYLLDLLGVMTVLTAIVGVSINYARRRTVEGTVFASHFDWQIRTFWWGLGAGAVGAALILVAEALGQPLAGAVGALVLLLALFWFVHRLLRGYMWLTAGEPVGGRKQGG